MGFVLGVDGGNTKTVALIAKTSGHIVGYGRGGCADISAAPTEEPALAEIDRAVGAALAMAGTKHDSIAVGYFCLAGADWPDDHAFLEDSLRRTYDHGRVVVANDAFGALRAGSPDGTGVVVSCGTGVAVAARNSAGEYWHSGFWAEPLCGVELGRQALRAVYRAGLGIDPPTALTAAVLARFGKPDVEQLLRGFEGRNVAQPTTAQLAALAPLLLDVAEAGDETARRILREHGDTIAGYARAAARRLGLDPATCTLVLNGGVFRHRSRRLQSAILASLGRTTDTEQTRVDGHEPAVGALILALEARGVKVGEAVMRELTASLPPATLYAS